MLLSGSFGLYLFSFSDFDTKIQEGEQIEAKTTTQEHISKWVCSNMPGSGGFDLYLFSFGDFDTKIEEGEQLEAKITTQENISKWVCSNMPESKDDRVLIYRMPRLHQKPVRSQTTQLECLDQNETCWRGGG